MLPVISVMLQNLSCQSGFVLGIRCLMYTEVLIYILCSVIHDNICPETDMISMRLM